MNYLPLIIIAVVLIGAMSLTRRTRQKAVAQQAEQAEQITFGTDVMTTSGLYGTVVGRNDDDTVQLAIAPGVEVKWALAALRDVASLPGSVSHRRPPEDESSDPNESPSA